MPDRVATSGPIMALDWHATGDSIPSGGISAEVMMMLLADAARSALIALVLGIVACVVGLKLVA